MSFKVKNISKEVIGLAIKNSTSLKQFNLQSNEYIIIDTITEQMKRLCEPVKTILEIKEV